MEITIKDLSINDQAEIIGYNKTDKAYRTKLLSMGLTKGTTFKLVKLAPLGDPIDIEVRGYNLTLRKNEAEALKIRRI